MRADRNLAAVLCISVVVGVLALAAEPTEAACTGSSPNWSATPDFASVNSCVSNAVTGDTVTVSAGSATWTSTLKINKAIVLRGAGINQTTITSGVRLPGRLIEWVTPSSGLPRLTGFSFRDSGTVADGSNQCYLFIGGTNPNFRFDHNSVLTSQTCGVVWDGYIRGVVDHNAYTLTNFKYGNYVFHGNWNNISPYGDGSYAAPTNLGTADWLIFEDNTSAATDGCSACPWTLDGWEGSRVVFRFNRLSNTVVDQHGTESAGRLRGIRAYEFYNNTFTADSQTIDGVYGLRGGTGVVWANTLTYSGNGYYSRFGRVENKRSDPACPVCGPPFNLCNGTVPYDQNTPGMNGYACLDMPGRGQGGLMSGALPSPEAWPNQVLEPIYSWQNTLNGANGRLEQAGPDPYGHLRENREWYNGTPSFNGSVGVGWGPIANRPNSCTTGVAYWATNEGSWNTTLAPNTSGRLYKCTATNTWTLYYTPYTYPHPLQGGGSPQGGGSSASPSPPSNLIVN
jgi:hypothetical protein